MRTIEIKRTGYKLEALQLLESVLYTISMTEHLNGDTVASHTFKIYDAADVEVTTNFAKSSSVDGSVLSIGVYAYAVGTYTIQVWVTCNEKLPDSTTDREFLIELTLTVK